MVKLLGSILILTAGVLTAQHTIAKERRRLAVLDGWVELLVYIRSQIDCFLTPVGEILEHADPALLRACTAGSVPRSLPQLFSAALPYLDPTCRRLLGGMIREIGSNYREEQLKRCDYYLAALQSRRDTVAASLPSRQKLCRALCICIAAGGAILLW